MGGIITEFKRLSTKSGSTMAFMTVEDVYGQIEVIVFPKVYDVARGFLTVEQTVKVVGKLQLKEGKPQIIAESIEKMEVEEEKTEEREYLGLLLPDDKISEQDAVLDILQSYPGDIRVYLAMQNKKYDTKLSIRKCDGLISELKSIFRDNEIIFFKKKS